MAIDWRLVGGGVASASAQMVVIPLVVTITAATRLCSGPTSLLHSGQYLVNRSPMLTAGGQMACLRDPLRNGAAARQPA